MKLLVSVSGPFGFAPFPSPVEHSMSFLYSKFFPVRWWTVHDPFLHAARRHTHRMPTLRRLVQAPGDEAARSPEKLGLPLIARLHEAASGRTLEAFSSQPAVQVYTANFLSDGRCWCSILCLGHCRVDAIVALNFPRVPSVQLLISPVERGSLFRWELFVTSLVLYGCYLVL